jgi:hypothetical protein
LLHALREHSPTLRHCGVAEALVCDSDDDGEDKRALRLDKIGPLLQVFALTRAIVRRPTASTEVANRVSVYGLGVLCRASQSVAAARLLSHPMQSVATLTLYLFDGRVFEYLITCPHYMQTCAVLTDGDMCLPSLSQRWWILQVSGITTQNSVAYFRLDELLRGTSQPLAPLYTTSWRLGALLGERFCTAAGYHCSTRDVRVWFTDALESAPALYHIVVLPLPPGNASNGAAHVEYNVQITVKHGPSHSSIWHLLMHRLLERVSAADCTNADALVTRLGVLVHLLNCSVLRFDDALRAHEPCVVECNVWNCYDYDEAACSVAKWTVWPPVWQD